VVSEGAVEALALGLREEVEPIRPGPSERLADERAADAQTARALGYEEQ
jgi:hypothetical protein